MTPSQLRQTHTYSTLEVSQETFDDVRDRMIKAYDFSPRDAEHYFKREKNDYKSPIIEIILGTVALVPEEEEVAKGVEIVVVEVGSDAPPIRVTPSNVTGLVGMPQVVKDLVPPLVVTNEMVGKVEAEVGMDCNSWDRVSPVSIIRAVLKTCQ